MAWFLSFQIAGFILIICAIYGYCRYRYLRFFRFIWGHKKRILIAEGVMIVVITLACYKPLMSTADCFIRGFSMEAKTKYSWWYSECRIKTEKGPYISIDRSRALPGEKNDSIEMEDH